ncbi:hypothetical protein LOZ27_000673 [Ophidiomyces ophidiicola]|nr:hypothetical protein LOZ27_000673 [Ophidiomyces ophidiicola]
MLSDLPPEIIYQVARHIPNLKTLANLARTCRRLHDVISADNYRILQAFVQSRFPSINTPPFWKDAARALTSRTRAFDRNAIIARFILPPENATRIGHPRTIRTDRPTLGYRPVLDSYEVWYGNTWCSRKEVLVWGAGADLMIRVKDFGRKHLQSHPPCEPQSLLYRHKVSGTAQDNVIWAKFNDLHGVDSWDDISGLHVLRPSCTEWCDEEDIIFGRRNGQLLQMLVSPKYGTSKIKKRYLARGKHLDGSDLSPASKVLSTTMDRKTISFFNVDTEDKDVSPFATLGPVTNETGRYKCSKILCEHKVAISFDALRGQVSIFEFSPDGIRMHRCLGIIDRDMPLKLKATTIEPLTATHITGGSPGDLFLTGREDSETRLHDIRARRHVVTVFEDTVDDSPTYSIKSIGHERFVVGGAMNALLKIFDMRMGRYSYTDAYLGEGMLPTKEAYGSPAIKSNAEQLSKKDISIFLSNRIENIPNRMGTFLRARHRYRGPIYAISHPSPSSSTIFAGLEDNVIGLDVVSTDDLGGKHKEWYHRNLDLALDPLGGVDCLPMDLSCYERPWPRDRQKNVKLMLQSPFYMALEKEYRGIKSTPHVKNPCWDQRWYHPWISGSRGAE